MCSLTQTSRFAIASLLIAWHPSSQAAVYTCEVNGETAYQAVPCQGGQTITIRPAPAAAPESTAFPPTGNPPIHYTCTPWQVALQDIAQRQQLDILKEDNVILIKKVD